MTTKTGRKKINPELKKVNLCVSIAPNLYDDIILISEKRVLGISKVVEILLTTTKTINELKN